MKKHVVLLSLLISTQVFATGGFECTSKSTGKLVIFGTTASVVGNPLINLTVIEGDKEVSYSRDQVMGYWNMRTELKVAVSDEEYMNLDYVLEAKELDARQDLAVAVGTLTNKLGQVVEVECFY